MKPRSSRRPLAAVALLAAVLVSGSLARAEAASPARAGRHGRLSVARGAAPTAIATVQHWVSRLLAEVGLAPTPTSTHGGAATAPTQTTLSDDNGAGIDPNG